MPVQNLSMENLGDIDDGSVAVAINQALRAAVNDCQDRPSLKKARKITLEISITPVMDKRDFHQARVEFTIKQTVPSKGLEVVMRPTTRGDGLEFHPTFSDNPDQLEITELDE